MRAVLLMCVTVSIAHPAWSDDLFVGTFDSESRENFGASTPGEYRIEVVAAGGGRYEATAYHQGKFKAKRVLVRCPVDSEDYLRNRPPGRAEVLCADSSHGVHEPVLSYSESGIVVPAIKEKYARNPELVKKEGLEPGHPSLFEARRHKAQYYARIGWYIFGFRKVSP